MAMQDLEAFIKGMSIFQEGVQRYRAATATNEAAQQMQEIANNEEFKGDLQARLQAQTQVANQLALKMSSAGASAADISAAAERLGVSAGAEYASGVVPETQKEKQRFEASSAEKAHQYKMEEIGAMVSGQATKKKGQQEISFLEKTKQEFNTKIKKSLDAYNSVQQAKAALASGNPIGDTSVRTTLVRLAGDVGNIPEEAKRELAGSPALIPKLNQTIEYMKSGRLTEANRAMVKKLIDYYEKSHKANITAEVERTAKTRAKFASQVGLDLNSDQIKDILWPEEMTDQGSAQPSPQQKPDASKYLLED